MYVKATGKAGKGKAGKDSPTHVPSVSPTIEVSTYLYACIEHTNLLLSGESASL